MQDTEITQRFLCAKSSFAAMQVRNPQTIRSDRWTELMESAASLSELPIYVDSRPSLKIQELLASARLYVRRYGVKLTIVDYLRLVEAPGRELRERVGHVANSLRELPKSERIGVVMLSQLAGRRRNEHETQHARPEREWGHRESQSRCSAAIPPSRRRWWTQARRATDDHREEQERPYRLFARLLR